MTIIHFEPELSSDQTDVLTKVTATITDVITMVEGFSELPTGDKDKLIDQANIFAADVCSTFFRNKINVKLQQ